MISSATVRTLWHYPVKGLSAQPLDSVLLVAGKGFPLDRAYGFAKPGSGFDPADPKPLPKTKFVMLARDAEIAGLKTRLDPETRVLTIEDSSAPQAFDLNSEADVRAAEALIARTIGAGPEAAPTLHSAHPHRFTDVSVVSPQLMQAISLINLDSVAAFGAQIGQAVDPARFRANILFSGLPALAELDMVGHTLTIGAATLRIIRRTKRCPATEVNPETCARDIDVPRLLREAYGHSDMGVYAEVIDGGMIRPGDTMTF